MPGFGSSLAGSQVRVRRIGTGKPLRAIRLLRPPLVPGRLPEIVAREIGPREIVSRPIGWRWCRDDAGALHAEAPVPHDRACCIQHEEHAFQ
jgi:hypothetical protein